MITYIKGNLFDSPAQVITNTVNCVGVMGKGIAKEFKRRFPVMFDDYKQKCAQNLVHAGEPYLWEDEAVQILNFPTKQHWRADSRLEFIENGLKVLAKRYQEWGIYTLALPPLGCGNGGLNWSDVKLLMEKYLAPIEDLEVFAFLPSVAVEKSNRNESALGKDACVISTRTKIARSPQFPIDKYRNRNPEDAYNG